MIRISAQGSLQASGEADQRTLAGLAGDWSVTSASPELILLRREAGPGGGSVLMTGEMRRPGWLVEVLSFVASSRLSGTLVVMGGEVRRELFFDGGMLKMASSSARADLFGEFVVSQGVISREQLAAALAAQVPGKRLGQILLDQGLLSGPAIYDLLCRKIEKIFHDTLMLDQGSYYFLADTDLSRLPASICIDTQTLLIHGTQRLDELRWYHEAVPRRTGQLEGFPAVLSQCTPAEQALGRLADGRRTLAQLDAELQLGPEATVAAAQRLKALGLLELLSRRESDADALQIIVDRFNRALGLIYQSVGHAMPAGQLTKLGREYIAGGTHANQHLRLLVPGANGEVSYANARAIYEQSPEKDRLTVIVLMLTHYLSFILFNANTSLPVEQQQAVHSVVNETLGPIWDL